MNHAVHSFTPNHNKEIYVGDMHLFGTIETHNDDDPVSIRRLELTPNSVQVFLHEDVCADEEESHDYEDVGFLIIVDPVTTTTTTESNLSHPIFEELRNTSSNWLQKIKV